MMTDAKADVIQSHAGRWEQRFADFVAEQERWFVDQNFDFKDWVGEGFNLDRLPYILEQLGWQPFQVKELTVILYLVAKERHTVTGSAQKSYRVGGAIQRLWSIRVRSTRPRTSTTSIVNTTQSYKL